MLFLDGSDKAVNGLCKDLSGTGMLIEVGEEIKEGVTCKTTLPSNNAAFPSLNATIKVLRCTKTAGNKFQLGTEILDIA